MSFNALHNLLHSADLPAVQRLLAAEPTLVHARDPSGETPLWLALESSPEAVMLLIQAGADVNARDVDDNTPLHQAAEDGACEQARVLIAHGANVHALNRLEQTPLIVAAAYGQADVAALLIAQGAKLNVKDARGYAPLHYAVYGNIPVYERDRYYKTAATLLQAVVNVTLRTDAGETVLALARRHSNNEATIDLLIEYGAP